MILKFDLSELENAEDVKRIIEYCSSMVARMPHKSMVGLVDFTGLKVADEVTQEVINQFADLTGDHTFLHVDTEAAAKGPFGTTIAHGFLTLVLMPQLKAPASYEITGFNTIFIDERICVDYQIIYC